MEQIFGKGVSKGVAAGPISFYRRASGVRAKSDVSSFMAVGFTAVIVLQAFIIVGGVTRLIPLTGLTLPFISQGGSSLLGSFIIVGFLLRAGDEATGVGTEMLNGTTSSLHSNSVLGRISLGKRLTNGMLLCSALFALLVANLTMIMVVQADSYQTMPGNNHTLAKEAKSERGTISTYDGIVLARSAVDDDGSYEPFFIAFSNLMRRNNAIYRQKTNQQQHPARGGPHGL